MKKKDIIKRPINPEHQANADTRDRAMTTEYALHTLSLMHLNPPGLLYLYGRGCQTYESFLRDRMRAIERELYILLSYAPSPKPKKQRVQSSSTDLYNMDINLISAAAFHLNLRRPKNELFLTSLYEINTS